ncbi:MAG: NADH-quinone oxidoreductase subunit J [Terrimicrobiaceae bacterium]|nr:NADH-quinone oxidoreductase subunit J [Terrimicrobiaceae bacterium]
MSLFLFWVFAAMMLAFGAGVVLLRNPVSSAMCLVMSFLGLASLFFTLDAYFIGIIQILVYAGAVMVLFLFIIMLLDLKAERARKFNIPAMAGGIAVLAGFVGILYKVLASNAEYLHAKPAFTVPFTSDVKAVGAALFTQFNLPFQIIGVLLLVATIGVVVLSKKELK